MSLKSISEHTNYRERLDLHLHQAFPLNSFIQYVKSLSNYDKLMLAITLQLPFTKKDLKQWPELLFYKRLNFALKKITIDRKLKKQLLLFLIDRTLVEAPPLNQFQQQLEQLLTEHGYWRVYWSLYFHPEKLNNESLFKQLHHELEDQLSEQELASTRSEQPWSNQELAATSELIEENKELEHKHDQHKIEKKIAVLEGKISKETATRQQLELAVAQKDKIIRQLQHEQDKLQQQTNLLKEQIAMYDLKIANLKWEEQTALQRRKEEEERWLTERAAMLNQNKQQLDEIRKLTQMLEDYQLDIEENKRQSHNWQSIAQQRKEEIEQLKNSKQPLDEQLIQLTEQMHSELDLYNSQLMEFLRGEDKTYEERLYVRKQMFNALELVGAIDKFQHEQQAPKVTSEKINVAEQEQPIAAEQLFTEEELSADKQQTPSEHQRYGTFYRRDHGGYIELDNGEQFNITESLVQQLELQHEAEVMCTPSTHPGRANHYTIELLFQGDDSFSPIHTYDGFVQLDEDQKWYCVDINDDCNRYPIHFKDIEIQKPSHGDPCTFNVAEDGHIARLTKLYRLAGDHVDVQHPARKKNEQRSKPTQRQKVEPFLQDCMITIIGGQRKWFESVVKETGAELVHDGGERPERIASDLSRSQALFMILTSTSHRATWEGIEIAKQNSIPHFVIQGSKSNLRKLLWDNQDVIRYANRAVEA